MRRCSRSPRDLAALLLLLALLGCGNASPVTLLLEVRPGLNDDTQTKFDTTSLESLLVLVSADGKIDSHAIKLDAVKAVSITPGNGIDKTKPLTVEVRGCEASTCERNSDVRFRGCNFADLSHYDAALGEFPLDVEMYPLNDGHIARCPAFDPAG